ncbi:hypothetical protein EMCRGX_G000044 [Ephydatia muelleri]
MAPQIQKKSQTGTAQELRKEDSPDWVGYIHSASNPLQTRANTELDPKRMMLAVVAQKIGGKTSGPHKMSEREKSPDIDAEGAKSPRTVPQKDQGMETSPTSVPISTRVEKAVTLSGEVPGNEPAASVVLPQTRSHLVRGLLSSLRRDTNPFSPHSKLNKVPSVDCLVNALTLERGGVGVRELVQSPIPPNPNRNPNVEVRGKETFDLQEDLTRLATHLALPAILRSRDTLGILLTQSLLLWMSLAPPPITLALMNGELSDPFNNIVVNKSDKGSEVVVSDMDHYIVEGVVHLSDVETYVPVGEDPTLAIAAERERRNRPQSLLVALHLCREDVATVAAQLGRGALLAKIDIKSAYRLIPVHPKDRWLLE